MKNSVRIGVVGAGVFGSYHAAKFAACDGASLVGIFDIDAKRAKSLADRFGAEAFGDFGDLLENADGVVIAAPATRHYALARRALESRRHLLVEKPLALSVADADTLISLADSNSVVLQVGHQERYVCESAGLLPVAESPSRIECIRRVPRTGRCEDVSVAFDLMVHDIDIVQQLTKSAIESVRAAGDRDEISAELILENGASVLINACRRASHPERRMSLAYQDRIVEFDFVKKAMIAREGREQLNGAAAAQEPLLALRDPLAHGADMFIRAIRGEAPSIVTGADGRACIDWARQIEDAAGLAGLAGADCRERMRA